ncbi:hypothetical protein BC936DRAFT_141085, partial [Jimgerdemannia flammicorona]
NNRNTFPSTYATPLQTSNYRTYLPSIRFRNLILVTLFFLPALSLTPMAWYDGYLHSNGDVAFKLVKRIKFCLWFVYLMVFGGITIFFGRQLTNILDAHLEGVREVVHKRENVRERLARLERMNRNLKTTFFNVSQLMFSYGIWIFIYGIFRDQILDNHTASIFSIVVHHFISAIIDAHLVISILFSGLTARSGHRWTSRR